LKKHGPYFLLVIFLFMLDHLTKIIVVQTIPLYSNIRIIPGFFNLTHIHNRGAVFGILSRSNNSTIHLLLMAASVMALGLILYYFFSASPKDKLMKIALSLILAGALGNLWDRLIQKYVVDFLDIYIKNWHWPTFNVADSCITIGAFLLIFVFFFRKG